MLESCTFSFLNKKLIFCFIKIFCIQIYYQYLADYLLNLIMHLFFQVQNLLFLIFCMDDMEYMTTLNSALFYFHLNNHLYLTRISLSHVPYGHAVIMPKVCNLLSSLLLSVILLISSVYSLCASLLNLCCGFSVIPFLNKQFL